MAFPNHFLICLKALFRGVNKGKNGCVAHKQQDAERWGNFGMKTTLSTKF